MPFDRRRYPPDWPAISRRIRDRSGGRCEGPLERDADTRGLDAMGRCTALNGRPHPVTGSRVVLTVAHINHVPMDCRPENLAACCQRCHLNYDRPRHVAAARRNRRARRACGDLFDLDAGSVTG